MVCSTKSMSWIMIPAVIGFFLGAILLQTQVDVASEIRVLNEHGTAGRALIVYHPGMSSFQEEVTFALVEGMIENDWACEVATAHQDAPVDASAYDVLVLGSPVYAWKPSTVMTRYIKRLETLSGVPVVLCLTAAGDFGTAIDDLRADVEAVGGVVEQALGVFRAAPNVDRHGIVDPLEIARRAGAQLALP